MDYPALQQNNIEIIQEMRAANRQYDSIRKYSEIEQARLQQRLNELRPKALTDPDAGRQYQELIEQNGRLLQILTDPSGY